MAWYPPDGCPPIRFPFRGKEVMAGPRLSKTPHRAFHLSRPERGLLLQDLGRWVSAYFPRDGSVIPRATHFQVWTGIGAVGGLGCDGMGRAPRRAVTACSMR